MFKKSLLLTTALAVTVGLASFAAQAAEVEVDATLNARAAISLTKVSDMDFGLIDYASTHAGDIRLGTNGTVSTAGTTGLVAGGAPTAAAVTVSGDGASTVDVSCDTGATLEATGGDQLTLSATEVSTAAGGVAPGAGNACAGVGLASQTIDLSATPNPTILMGGTINVDGDAISENGVYSTTTAGSSVTLSVVYQ